MKKKIRVSYEYELSAKQEEGIEYLINELKKRPTFQLSGGSVDFGCYHLELVEDSGEVKMKTLMKISKLCQKYQALTGVGVMFITTQRNSKNVDGRLYTVKGIKDKEEIFEYFFDDIDDVLNHLLEMTSKENIIDDYSGKLEYFNYEKSELEKELKRTTEQIQIIEEILERVKNENI